MTSFFRRSSFGLLALILLGAIFLRLPRISLGDTMSDEVFYAFRAVGMLDFDGAEFQATPLEWFDGNIPVWTRLSFHDHPPLVFLVQHFSMALFGETNFAMRFPSAIFGIGTICMLYFLVLRLFGKREALLAAAFLALTLNHVFISRVGLQESYVIFFSLLFFLCLLKAEEHSKWFLAAGAALGLGLLAKYTSGVVVLAALPYLCLQKPTFLKDKRFWQGVLVAALIFSPVIVYNLQLYRAVGHFDFQISHIVGQRTEEWKVQPGKEIGTVGDRVTSFVPHLLESQSWLFLLVSFFSLPFLFHARRTKGAQFLISVLGAHLIVFLLLGTAYRFLSMLTPYLAILAALGLSKMGDRRLTTVVIACVLVFEAVYSINNQLLDYPHGPHIWGASPLSRENYKGGYNELGDFFDKEFEGLAPLRTFDAKYQFLNDLRDREVSRAEREGRQLLNAFVVVGDGMDNGAKLWRIDRHSIYHSWPILSSEAFFEVSGGKGLAFYREAGFTSYYYIVPTVSLSSEELRPLELGAGLVHIKNRRGEEAFRIYIGDL